MGLMLTLAAIVSGGADVPAQFAVEPFPLTAVRLSDGPCKVALEANQRYLHSLELDSLLYNCRQVAGLPAPGKPLGGWESPDSVFRGHFIGHYLTACSLLYAAAGDEEMKQKGDKMVAELAKCQEANGNGYLSAFPEVFFDRVESERNEPWAVPYYSIHKIMQGMIDMYTLCGNQQALDVVKRMADYFEKRAAKHSVFSWDRTLLTEFGGMSEMLGDLYAITKEPRYLALAHKFDHAAFLGPLLLEHDDLSNVHGNSHIPKVLGAARRYELTGDERYRKIATFFWDLVTGTRCYVTGGCTSGEHWPEPNKLAHTLSPTNQECCTTHNMLKLTRYLFRWTADPEYADFYERAFFNGILGTQNPETGMLLYYVGLAPGSTKRYGTPLDSFWCCYGTGIESFSKLADSIYFHDADGIYVNLFVASTVDWKEKGVRLEQQTTFPEEQGSAFIVHCDRPTSFALHIHVPYWVAKAAELRVNDERQDAVLKPTSFAVLKREWRDGDRVQVKLPMSLHTHPMPDDPDLMAIMYGPVVLLRLVDEEPTVGRDRRILPAIGAEDQEFLTVDPAKSESWIKPVEGRPLTFRATPPDASFTLVPFYKVIDERYKVYHLFAREGGQRYRQIQERLKESRELEARFVDYVLPGGQLERAHNLQGEGTEDGMLGGYHWRHATGWWSWDMKVLPDAPMTLLCTLWGSDAGRRTYDILIDGEVIATQTMNRQAPGKNINVEFPIPRALTEGKNKVTVRFQAHEGNIAGGVFGCAILKP
jgi:DUF1680 family protein